ncbi:MAG: glycosyltransferase [Cyclobacteriaceae bacterium]
MRDRFFFKKKGSVLVVCWNMSHNPLGRAFLFADFLRRNYHTKIVGPIFPKFSKKIWFPLRKYLRGADTFTASNFPEFLDQATEFAKSQPKVDIVIICKPRLPSIFIGLLIAQKNNAKVILDIDDYELAFFENQDPLLLEDAIKDGLDLSCPYHETWTRICQSWIHLFPYRIVSNHKLQEKFGGTIIPHVRNERIFDPQFYNRSWIRKKHGYSPSDKVILFLGTPREHKGFEEIPRALKKIGNPNYKFCLIGKIRNDALRTRFLKKYGHLAQVFTDSDFRDLPEKLCIADMICLLQDEKSLVSEYQLPAKLIDAIAMEIPVLVRPIGPLEHYANQDMVISLTDPKKLAETIDQLFKKIDVHRDHAKKIRSEYFNSRFSFRAGSNQIEQLGNSSKDFSWIKKILTEIETYSSAKERL